MFKFSGKRMWKPLTYNYGITRPKIRDPYSVSAISVYSLNVYSGFIRHNVVLVVGASKYTSDIYLTPQAFLFQPQWT